MRMRKGNELLPYAHGYPCTNVIMAFGPGTNLVSTCYFKSDPAFRATFEIPGDSVITLVQGLILFRCGTSRIWICGLL
jgi:hypothetical protein